MDNMNMQEASRVILGLRAAGWNEKDINDFILYIETGEEKYKPTEKNRIKNTPQRLTHELPWGLLLFTDSEKSATHMCLTHPNSFSVCDEFKQAIFLRIIGRHQPRPCPLQSCRLWSRWHCSS